MNVLIGRNRNKNKNPTQLLWLCSLLSFSSVNKVNSYGLSTNNNYFTVIRTSLDKANIISLQPQGWLNKATRNSYGYRNSNNKNSDDKNVNEITKSSNRIREVLYVPSIFNMKLTNEIDHVLDDEHVCSLLCDRGFTVHCVNPKNNIDYKNAIADTMKWRMTKNVLPRNIAILANELAVPQVMSYLAEMALPMTPDRADIGAVVLVDSAPINDMHSIAEIEDTVLTPYLELIQQNNSDGLYRKYINQKREAGSYLFKLIKRKEQMSVNYNTLEKQNWMDNPIPNVTDEEWKEFESFFSTKSYDKEYEEFKALSNRKRKKKPSGWSTANPFTVAESDARPSDIINKEITARAVVGNPPRMFASVSQAMKNRILVVSTLFPPPFTADYYDDDDDENDDEDEDEDEDDFDDDFEDFDEDSMDFTDELVDGEDDDMVLEGNDKTGSCSGSDLSGSNREATDVYYFIENRKQRADLQSQSSRKVHMDYIDDYEDLTEIGMPYDVLINNNDGMYSSWGVDALEELAQLYNAGPVIYAEMVPDEEVYLPLHLENDFDFIPNKRRGYSQIEDFNSIATDSDKKDNDKSKNDVIDVWTSSEKKRHAKLFTVVSDWFDMLTEFKCI